MDLGLSLGFFQMSKHHPYTSIHDKCLEYKLVSDDRVCPGGIPSLYNMSIGSKFTPTTMQSIWFVP